MSPFTSETDAIDLSRLLTWWIEFAKTSPVPIYVAENRYPATLEAGVVQVVNAAETLHRALHADGSDDATAAEVREVLKSAGMYTSKRRADIYRALVKWTPLERRLRELGSAGGDDFAAWLLDGQLRNWAIVASRVRNLLAHGGTSKSRIEQDLAAQAGVLEVTRAVIVARLLIAAGVPADERLFSRDRRFLAIVHQRLADWQQLAEALDVTTD